MQICIPTLDRNGFNSEVSPHFGKASVFAVVNDETNEISFLENDGTHHGGTLTPAQIIGQAGVDIVLCSGLGVKAVRLFEQQGIMVYCNAAGTVTEALNAYKNGALPAATDQNACQHHGH